MFYHKDKETDLILHERVRFLLWPPPCHIKSGASRAAKWFYGKKMNNTILHQKHF